MTNVTILTDSKQSCTGVGTLGHAGPANDHQDKQKLVCIAASALTLNMANSVEQFTDGAFETDTDEGTDLFKFRSAQSFNSELKLLMNPLVSGLKGIVGMYGESYIKIRFRGV